MSASVISGGRINVVIGSTVAMTFQEPPGAGWPSILGATPQFTNDINGSAMTTGVVTQSGGSGGQSVTVTIPASVTGFMSLNARIPYSLRVVVGGIMYVLATGELAAYTEGASITESLALLGNPVPANASVYVDPVLGNDTTGQRGNPTLPFKTIVAAVRASQFFDTIYLGNGLHTATQAAALCAGRFYNLAPQAYISDGTLATTLASWNSWSFQAAGLAGFVDFTNPNLLWQDGAGTVPVTAQGQNVKSASNATTPSGGVLTSLGSQLWVGDGTNFLTYGAPGAVAGAAAQNYYVAGNVPWGGGQYSVMVAAKSTNAANVGVNNRILSEDTNGWPKMLWDTSTKLWFIYDSGFDPIAVNVDSITNPHVYIGTQSSNTATAYLDGVSAGSASESTLPPGTTNLCLIGDAGNGAKTTIYYMAAVWLQVLTAAQLAGWTNAGRVAAGSY